MAFVNRIAAHVAATVQYQDLWPASESIRAITNLIIPSRQ